MTEVTLKTTVEHVPHPTNDCLVRRAVVRRLHPDGRRWMVVRPDEDPEWSHRMDREALRRAEAWADRPETGYAIWSSAEGYVWVNAFGEGDEWTPIPERAL